MACSLSVCSGAKGKWLKASFDFLYIRVCVIVDARLSVRVCEYLCASASLLACLSVTAYVRICKQVAPKGITVVSNVKRSPPDTRYKKRDALFIPFHLLIFIAFHKSSDTLKVKMMNIKLNLKL